MLKDYQEDTTAEKLAHEIAKLFDDGFATPTFGQIEKIELLVTTYGNARELQGVEKVVGEILKLPYYGTVKEMGNDWAIKVDDIKEKAKEFNIEVK